MEILLINLSGTVYSVEPYLRECETVYTVEIDGYLALLVRDENGLLKECSGAFVFDPLLIQALAVQIDRLSGGT